MDNIVCIRVIYPDSYIHFPYIVHWRLKLTYYFPSSFLAMSITIKVGGGDSTKQTAKSRQEAEQKRILTEFPPPGPVALYPSADQDLYAFFNLYPHVIHGKFYRQDDKPLKTSMKKMISDVEGPELEATLDKHGANTGVIQDDNSKLYRVGRDNRLLGNDNPPDFPAECRLGLAVKQAALQFRMPGNLELLPPEKVEKRKEKKEKH